MIKSRRMRSAGHVACMGIREIHIYRIFGGNVRRDHYEDLDVGDNIKMDSREMRWIGLNWIIWLRIGTSGELL
jgi:hypothetical protein